MLLNQHWLIMKIRNRTIQLFASSLMSLEIYGPITYTSPWRKFGEFQDSKATRFYGTPNTWKFEYLHPWKLTWQWKNTIFNRRYIFKQLFFHCHVSFRECTTYKSQDTHSPTKPTNPGLGTHITINDFMSEGLDFLARWTQVDVSATGESCERDARGNRPMQGCSLSRKAKPLFGVCLCPPKIQQRKYGMCTSPNTQVSQKKR